MRTLALFPGLDGTGDLYKPLIQELSDFDCRVFTYPESLHQPNEIADYLLKHNSFSDIDIFVAESFGCRVLVEIFQKSQKVDTKALFLAGFDSVHSRYKFALKVPGFALQAVYKRASNQTMLNFFCLGNTKDKTLLDQLKNTLTKVPFGTVIGRLHFLANSLLAKSKQNLNSAKFVVTKNDKLLSIAQQKRFVEKLGIKEVIELDAPHFVAQTKAADIARLIREL